MSKLDTLISHADTAAVVGIIIVALALAFKLWL